MRGAALEIPKDLMRMFGFWIYNLVLWFASKTPTSVVVIEVRIKKVIIISFATDIAIKSVC